jgi:hypothetical protein
MSSAKAASSATVQCSVQWDLPGRLKSNSRVSKAAMQLRVMRSVDVDGDRSLHRVATFRSSMGNVAMGTVRYGARRYLLGTATPCLVPGSWVQPTLEYTGPIRNLSKYKFTLRQRNLNGSSGCSPKIS